MRKIVQIAAYGAGHSYSPKVVALCCDGSLWAYNLDYSAWDRVPDVPQDEPGRPPAPEPEEPDPDMDLSAEELGELLDPAGPDTQQTVKDALDKWKNNRGLR